MLRVNSLSTKPSIVESGSEQTQSRVRQPLREATWFVPVATLLCGAVAICYLNVLFNWFVGDDFVHLLWLKQAVHNPELILRNFHSSWLDLTTTKFYRPLISVFMVSDYLMWGINGAGFHLTNVIFLCIGALSLYAIMRKVCASSGGQEYGWPVLAALLFAVYPLHSEAVAWITGRVDAVVTAFMLLSFYAYIRWRESKAPLALALTYMSAILALLSKEMAITIPPLFTLYELTIAEPLGTSSLSTRIRNALKYSSQFWALLAGYFVVRRFALGTLVGGYDDSLFHIANWHTFVFGWLHGLHMLVVPVNRTLMGSHNVLTIVWQCGVALSVVLTVTALRNQFLRSRILFLSLWLILSLAPVYKLFAISDDLQGSRLAYVATVPLCGLLAAGFSRLIARSISGQPPRLNVVLACAIAAILPVSGILISIKNNSAWASAGSTANAIRRSLAAFYKETPGDPQVLIMNLPDQRNGSYICRNALEGMTEAPQLERNIKNCLMINASDHVLPLGYLKTSLAQSAQNVRVLNWNKTTRSLVNVELPRAASQQPGTWALSASQLAQSVAAEKASCRIAAESDRIRITPFNPTKKPESIVIQLPSSIDCFSTDFIEAQVVCHSSAPEAYADLLYETRTLPQFNPEDKVRAVLNSNDRGAQTLIFPVRGRANWILGGQANRLMLTFPANSDLSLIALRGMPAPHMMPSISFPNSGYLGTKGYGHLSDADNKLKLGYAVDGIPGARSAAFEVTLPNQCFEWPNAVGPSAQVMKTITRNGVKGTLTLDRSMFPVAGLYEVRCIARDSNDKAVGIPGDHICISVDN